MRDHDFLKQDACDEVQLCSASPIRRLLASLIDMAIYCTISALLFLPLIRELPSDGAVLDVLTLAAGDPRWIGHAAGLFGLWIAIWWAYFILGWGLIGGTPGQLFMGLRVVDNRGRCPIGATRALMRLLAYCSSSLTFLFGHILAVFRRDRRSLHDILAGTRVVRRKSLLVEQGGLPADQLGAVDSLEAPDDEMTASHVLVVAHEEDVDGRAAESSDERDPFGEDLLRDNGIES